MTISSAKATLDGSVFLVTLDGGAELSVPVNGSGNFPDQLQAWVDSGGVIAPADPAPPKPTDAEIYDQIIQNQKVFKGYMLAVNDGSIVPGSNMTGAQLKAAVKAKM